ncbi:hypothetical protein NDU88_004052 [Pleurodeles waltl]|uniref:Uncharacterized protein n=1 Tax=Pleurodeles waltl TaxID=8319 RepID=A0AAV7MFH5_PLEWA|nr:hypothetical protein NDU88_004052 [Pleurodeles waltl]
MGRVSLVRVDPTRGGHPGEGVPASRRAEDGHRLFTGSAGGGGITCPPCGMPQDLKLAGFFRGRSPPSGEPNCYRGALMVSPWCLVPPQARDSVDSRPLLGQHPPGPKTPRTQGGGGAHEVVILPARYPPGVQAPGLRYVDPPESGPLPPIAPPLSLPCQSRGCGFPACAPLCFLPEVALPRQCIRARVPSNQPADPRGRPAPESPVLSAANRACGLPLGPSSGVLDGVASPGAAPASPVGPRRSGPVRRPPGCLGRGAIPASAQPGPPVGATSQRR